MANERYRLEQFVVPAAWALATFDERVRDRPDLRMVYARMNVAAETFLENVFINAFFLDPDGEIPPLSDAAMDSLRRAVFRGSAESEYGKVFRWNAETNLQPMLAGKIFSRNQLMNEGVEVFQN